MGEVITIGLDIAKSVFLVRRVDAAGAVVIRKRVSRAKYWNILARRRLVWSDSKRVSQRIAGVASSRVTRSG
jgi:hypothetical protein